MAIYDISDCTCYKSWSSILPPPPCPVHRTSEQIVPQFGYQRMTPCSGRHCAHDAGCFAVTP
jgi:hypothetical protein